MAELRGKAFNAIADRRPKHTYRGAVVGCGRMGSTIDDEHIDMPHYPWPWAHAPAMIEAHGIDLVAAADSDPEKLDDFKQRWAIESLYMDYRQMVEKEQPDVVVVTTRPEPRAEIVIELAEMGVKAIFATKPMCRTLAEADAMIQACQKNNVILSMACHLNWYNWYTNARKVIADGLIGNLRSMICHSPASLSNLQSHTFALFRLFAGTPAKWVFGVLDNDQQAESHGDIPGSGYIVYENGIRAIMNSHAERTGLSWTIEFVGEKGRIISRNAHAQFELWTAHPETNAPIQTQFPNPWYPRSSMVDAIEGVCLSIEKGVEEICPGEFGRETLEIAIAIRESHKQGNTRLDIPLMDRSLRMG